MTIRIATFNLENFDDDVNAGPNDPTLQQRIAAMRPQLVRIRADVLCLQEVHSPTLPAGDPSEAGHPIFNFPLRTVSRLWTLCVWSGKYVPGT